MWNCWTYFILGVDFFSDHFLSAHLNWDILSQGGFSTSFQRQLAATRSANSTFSFGMEMSGVLFKRSSFEVSLEDEPSGEKVSFLQVSWETGRALIEPEMSSLFWSVLIRSSRNFQLDMFANGLGSLMGGEEESGGKENAEDPESNAGMELRILGNSLRPFIFFESMSDIMSLYWSGKLDEKTSALQVNSRINDVYKRYWGISNSCFRLFPGLPAPSGSQLCRALRNGRRSHVRHPGRCLVRLLWQSHHLHMGQNIHDSGREFCVP